MWLAILLLVSAVHYSSAEYCTFGITNFDYTYCVYGCCSNRCCGSSYSVVSAFDSTYIYYIVGGVIGGLVLLAILITLCCVVANNSSRRGRVVTMPMNQPQISTVSSSQMNPPMYPHGSQPQCGSIPGQYYPPQQYSPAPGQYNPPPGQYNPPPGQYNPPPGQYNPPPGQNNPSPVLPAYSLPNQPQETESTNQHPPPETLNQAERIPENNPLAQAAGTTNS